EVDASESQSRQVPTDQSADRSAHSKELTRPSVRRRRSAVCLAMQEITRKRAIGIWLRARAPLVVRAAALIILVAALLFVAVSYYRLRNNKPFRLKSEAP